MTYHEARSFIEETTKYGYVLGLGTISELLRRLGNPQDDLKFVHIAGTNGKGSVLAYLSTILKHANYKVGRYISPTVFSYRERIQVNEEYISREDVAGYTERIRAAGQEMLSEGLAHPTCFEVETAMAFLYFKDMNCDIVVLETGMGGLTDATNVVKTTLVSVLVPISMDHMGYLGDTLCEIAAMKAGIIKPNTTVVSASQQRDAEAVIEDACIAGSCSLRFVDNSDITNIAYGYEKQYFSYKTYSGLEIPLAGNYQIQNAALAVEVIEALDSLGFPVSEEQLRKGLKETKWSGRFTIIGRNPLFIIDGAHNRDAADRLKETLELHFPDKRKIFIMGVLADKEYDYIAGQTAPLADRIITIMTPDNPRALSAAALADTVRKYNPQVEAAASLEEAVKLARSYAKDEDVILAFGSLSYLGELVRNMETDTNDK